jgi:hypothetical protein
MSDDSPRPRHVRRSEQTRRPDREEIWDLFVDELDRCGQAGSAADVLTPTTLDPDAPSGKRFGDLTRVDIDSLAKIAGNLGRRGDVVKTMWEQTQQRLKMRKRGKA